MRTKTIQKVLWSTNTRLDIIKSAGGSCSTDHNSDMTINATSIDGLVPDVKIIEIDIDGAKLKALMGARDQVVANEPSAAVFVFDLPAHLLSITEHITALRSYHKFYFRHYSHLTSDRVLYAV
jgi:hypothetical protein